MADVESDYTFSLFSLLFSADWLKRVQRNSVCVFYANEGKREEFNKRERRRKYLLWKLMPKVLSEKEKLKCLFISFLFSFLLLLSLSFTILLYFILISFQTHSSSSRGIWNKMGFCAENIKFCHKISRSSFFHCWRFHSHSFYYFYSLLYTLAEYNCDFIIKHIL